MSFTEEVVENAYREYIKREQEKHEITLEELINSIFEG